MRAYPGTTYDWWLGRIEAYDDQLIATALDLLDTKD